MKHRLLVLLLAIVCLGSVVLSQEGPPPVLTLTPDIENGEQIATQQCVACHGPNGNSTNPMFPRLAGQFQEWIAVQAWLFKQGIRQNPMMNQVAANLSDQEIADAAAWFAAQTPAGEPFAGQDPAAVERGAELFMRGNVEAGLVACAICHGNDGSGIRETFAPRIAGQSPEYLRGILTLFAQVPDFGEPHPNAMHIVASALSEEDLNAVVAYLASEPWSDQ